METDVIDFHGCGCSVDPGYIDTQVLECIYRHSYRCWIKCCLCIGAFCLGFVFLVFSLVDSPEYLSLVTSHLRLVTNQHSSKASKSPVSDWFVVNVVSSRVLSFHVASLSSSHLFLNHYAPLGLREDLHLQRVVQLTEFIKILC